MSDRLRRGNKRHRGWLAALTGAALLAACGRAVPVPSAPRGPAPAMRVASAPSNFLWGVSTAGYQWEGQDRSSQWAAFDAAGRTAERNPRGADGLVRWEEDLDLTRGLGCNAFRTSIEWARVEPSEGVYDRAAIEHYHRLFRGMRARGIEPVVTLMHFAYPAWLDRYGGWESKEAPAAFARHAAFVAREFGDEIRWYVTFNEPNVFLIGGWLSPMMPPGKVDPVAGLRAMRRMIQAHGDAYDAVHAADRDAMVSFNMYTAEWAFGAPTAPLGAAAARDPKQAAEHEVCSETAFADALVKAGHKKLDYAALDYYCKFRLYLPFVFPRPDTWEVYPEGIYNAVKRYHQRYKLPVLGYIHWSITDNYEWGSFSPRFGLFSVDCRNGDFTRRRADGAEAFEAVIGAQGVTEAIAARWAPPTPLALPAPWQAGGTGTPVSIGLP